ncbi:MULTISPECIES: threonine synthase [Clostridium]|mgnify:CR=1 FL=1|uniref:Threonine synthase n=1 Tax=Clostridium lapidicellarium TaxID=3240931 RepID=A0ABV4DWU8_9CLOT
MEEIYYNSTRGSNENLTSASAILKGIAGDGGLFIPNCFPFISKRELKNCEKMSFKQLSLYINKKFFTDFSERELKNCIDRAYDNKFEGNAAAPLNKKGDVFYLELFHGPTMAFKDIALCLLPYLMKTAARKRNLNKTIVILTATSGDTGKAALESFADVEGTKIVVFFPEKGVSSIQKRQMTTQIGENVKVVGINGNFDDAQKEVKRIFNDVELKRELNRGSYMFSSANSINIGRLIPQIVYYFYSYMQLLRVKEIKLGEKINFAVPTGNFGNILAAYYSKKMGLPVNKLLCASNENKVLCDFFNSGIYDANRKFFVTISPSMDILMSSNLERFIYDISGKNASAVRELMGNLDKFRKYEIGDNIKEGMDLFYGNLATDEETKQSIKEVFDKHGYLMDPHTSVAYSVYKKYLQDTGDGTKTVIVSTASPFKFTRAVMGALDNRYNSEDDFKLVKLMSRAAGIEIPKPMKKLDGCKVMHDTVCETGQMETEVRKFLSERCHC